MHSFRVMCALLLGLTLLHASSINQSNLVAEVIFANSSTTGTANLAVAPGAGNYEIHYNLDLHTACTTGQAGLGISFAWTGDASRTASAGVWAISTTNSTDGWYSGETSLHVISGNVTYTLTLAPACASGTPSWDGDLYLIRIP